MPELPKRKTSEHKKKIMRKLRNHGYIDAWVAAPHKGDDMGEVSHVLYMLVWALSNPAGVFRPNYSHLLKNIGLEREEVDAALAYLMQQKLIVIEGDNWRLLAPPDNWAGYERHQRLKQLGLVHKKKV